MSETARLTPITAREEFHLFFYLFLFPLLLFAEKGKVKIKRKRAEEEIQQKACSGKEPELVAKDYSRLPTYAGG